MLPSEAAKISIIISQDYMHVCNTIKTGLQYYVMQGLCYVIQAVDSAIGTCDEKIQVESILAFIDTRTQCNVAQVPVS